VLEVVGKKEKNPQRNDLDSKPIPFEEPKDIQFHRNDPLQRQENPFEIVEEQILVAPIENPVLPGEEIVGVIPEPAQEPPQVNPQVKVPQLPDNPSPTPVVIDSKKSNFVYYAAIAVPVIIAVSIYYYYDRRKK